MPAQAFETAQSSGASVGFQGLGGPHQGGRQGPAPQAKIPGIYFFYVVFYFQLASFMIFEARAQGHTGKFGRGVPADEKAIRT